MAESVAYRTERALPEYEQMQALKLFTKDEISKIKKKREECEYSINQPTRSIKDYVEYLKYERSIITLTRERSKLAKNTSNHTIISSISGRMKILYSEATTRFPANVRLWDEYIKFLQLFKFNNDISGTYDRMLKYHGNKADVWIRAIFWEYNENYSDDRVKGLLLRAQQFHPESQKLYTTFFQIELENKRKSSEEIALKHADVVYANAKKKFTNIEFFLEMLKIVDRFAYAKPLQQTILEEMQEKFAQHELMWHIMAQRELNAGVKEEDSLADEIVTIKLDDSDESAEGESSTAAAQVEDTKETPDAAERKRIEICVQVYETAIQALKSKKMWKYYIDAMLDLNKDTSWQPALKRFVLGKAMKKASETNHMSEEHYLKYLEILFNDNVSTIEIMSIFKKATSKYQMSLKLWTMYMNYYLQRNDFENVRFIFRKAKKHLGKDSVSLWHKYLLFLRLDLNSERNAEFNRCINELATITYPEFSHIKASVIEMHAITMNIQRARKIYRVFIQSESNCYEVYEMMSKLEANQLQRDKREERNVLETMVHVFGATRPDAWIRYMRYEREFGDPMQVTQLYQRAIKTLKPELLDDFNTTYNFFSNGVV